MILEEAGKLVEALTLIDESQDKIRDRLGMMEARGRLLLKAGYNKDSADVFRWRSTSAARLCRPRITNSNGIQFVLYDMQNRTTGRHEGATMPSLWCRGLSPF
jgi:hypothetical protein